MWRTGGDNTNSYAGMVANFTRNVQHYRAAQPGGWNNPDMLEVGNGTMTAIENRAEIGLWSEMAAPLIAGNDLTTMSANTRNDLTNPAVIAVDQDPLGRQGHPVTSAGGHWVLTKPLANGSRAVVLFNQTDQPAVITTTARQIGLPSAPKYLVAHLWSHTTTTTTGKITAKVRPHGAGMLQVTPASK
jgi:alpha-galactosidase